jgi:hypothetical protein
MAKHTERALLERAIRSADELAALDSQGLDLVLRVARRARLLGRLAFASLSSGTLQRLPATAVEQLNSALVTADARRRLVLWELDRVTAALSRGGIHKIVVLKGCAYLLEKLPNSAGRMVADVDLLLEESDLTAAERILEAKGWQTTKLSAYDQHYYRAWTHELPPLVHAERETEVDLHHNILPRTARLRPQSRVLLANVQRIDGGDLYRLADADLVLHAMTHLMFDSALTDALRDLVDIDDLLRHYLARSPDFCVELVERSTELELERPAFYALRYAKMLLGTPVSDDAIERSRRGRPWRPVLRLMDSLVPRALYPVHPDHRSHVTELARWLLYVRSLWIRMPPLLLLRHLSRKFYERHIARRRQPSPQR